MLKREFKHDIKAYAKGSFWYFVEWCNSCLVSSCVSVKENQERSSVMACMLSTSDNPYNPFTQFREWYAFDVAHGYRSCEYLARVSNVSPELSSEEYDAMTEIAVDECVRLNLTGNRIKVVAE